MNVSKILEELMKEMPKSTRNNKGRWLSVSLDLTNEHDYEIATAFEQIGNEIGTNNKKQILAFLVKFYQKITQQ